VNTASEQTTATLSVLVVDDDPTDLKLVHSLLTSEGHTVTEAKDAEQALLILTKSRPDIILIDMELPGMNGFALARELKHLPETVGIPIIAMTAYPEHFSQGAASVHGFSAYFVKPINTRTLVPEIVAAALRGCENLRSTPILIADDNGTNRRLLRAILETEGYRVVEVNDGREALSLLIAAATPMVALLDWEMPGLEGIEVCRKTRAIKDAQPTFLILLTVRDSKQDIVTGLQAGANDYITKPFERGELLARVKIAVTMVELQQSLANKVMELQDALAEVKQLSGYLPICAYCKKIRDDTDYWQQVEVYVSKHSDAKFSHGVCPECYKAVVEPELYRLGIGNSGSERVPVK
jgi:sigma-B regulation protein RsbU (phosphoserine phosphatase)